MKQNVDSIAVPYDKKLHEVLVKIFKNKKNKCEVALESGTFEGLGTSTLIANAIIEAKREDDILFYTLEAKDWVYKVAKKNLEKYNFIQPLYGLSVGMEEALDFISNDEMIKHPENYPDIIGDAEDSKLEWFYRTEIYSCFKDNPNPPIERMFEDLIPRYKDRNLLICLDSCGGIGLMEFQKVVELMGNNPYWLMFDDLAHVKQCRTYEIIKKDKNWKILFDNGRVCVAKFGGVK